MANSAHQTAVAMKLTCTAAVLSGRPKVAGVMTRAAQAASRRPPPT
jgi:hypothetical protein